MPGLRPACHVRKAVCAWAWVAACGVACSQRPPPEAVVLTSLGPDQVARVDLDDVSLAEVQAVAVAQSLAPVAARERVIEDALWAAAARHEPRLTTAVHGLDRAALARALIQELEREARAAGPPSDAEVLELSAERWTTLDRPVTVQVTHAVVRTDTGADATLAARGAQRLAEAVHGVSAPEEFLRKAQALTLPGLEIRAERLPAVTSDGRTIPTDARGNAPPAELDPQFARAAHAIALEGTQSGIVQTPYGYHVILLERRFPEERPSLESRRASLAEEIELRRGRAKLAALVAELRSRTTLEFERAVDALTARATTR